MYKQALLFAKLKAIGEGDEKRLTLDIDYPLCRLGELGLDFAINDKSYHSEGGGSIPYDAKLEGVEVIARVTLPTEFEEKIKKEKGYQGDTFEKVDKVKYVTIYTLKKGDVVVGEKDGLPVKYDGADKDEPKKFENL